MSRIDFTHKNPWIPDWQNGQDIFTPADAENIEYIKDQILYRHRLLLEANGELFQLFQKKQRGQVCDNPKCPASSNFRNDPNSQCPRCLGTRFIGGYDYMGEILCRINAPTMPTVFTLKPGGTLQASQPKSWCLPTPRLYPFDIMVSLTRPRIIQDVVEVDIQLNRRVDISANFDKLPDSYITNILKISNNANQTVDYKVDIDYTLSNDGVLWTDFGNRPDDMDSYFVTYQKSEEHIRRFQITSVNPIIWRDHTVLHQEFDMTELDVTHPLYKLLPIRDWDMYRYYYPFPVDQYYER